MNNKVDKLFKDKLEQHSLPPSAQAWEKVEAHLGKKNKMVVWRAAAALVLVGSVTFMILNWDRETPKEIAKTEHQESGDKSQQSQIKSQETEVRSQDNEKGKQPAPERSVVKKKSVVKQADPVITEQQLAIVEQPDKLPLTNSGETVTTPEIKKEKGITLTYTLPSIKKEQPAVEVAQEEIRKTGMQRVLEIAREVKNGDSPLAELREAKDDIFALDFKKDKNKKH